MESDELDYGHSHGSNRFFGPRIGAKSIRQTVRRRIWRYRQSVRRELGGVHMNWKMLAQPINYLIVILMLTIAGIGGHMILSLGGIEPVTPPK